MPFLEENFLQEHNQELWETLLETPYKGLAKLLHALLAINHAHIPQHSQEESFNTIVTL